MILPSIVTWIYFVSLAGDVSQSQQIAFGIGKAIQFAFPLAWVAVFAREPLRRRSESASLADTRTGLIWGFGSGVLIVLAMLGLYHLILSPNGYFDAANAQIIEKVRGFGVASRSSFFFLAAFYALVHSGLEEYYWRWFAFGQLDRLLGFGWAAIISSLGFMAHHVILLAVYFGWSSPLTYFLSSCVAIGGLIWCWLYRRTGSLTGPWLSHLFVDAGIFLIGYEIVREIFV
ncbi:MAG: CPBP family intramembrane metalloprotease [Planctomycetales bacterium]|nr:CPBP family intramembrane metalloprotease [Planctomycetales bacterium]